MFNKNTVLILGAGASAPYGFPLGTGLVDALMTGPERQAADIIADHFGHGEREIAEFKLSLGRSMLGSIDQFLSDHPDLVALGNY